MVICDAGDVGQSAMGHVCGGYSRWQAGPHIVGPTPAPVLYCFGGIV